MEEYSVDNYPKEWQVNKNLRWWLKNLNPEKEVIVSPDTIFVNEATVVEFAKQYDQERLAELEKENKRMRDFIYDYFDNCGFDNIEEKINEVLTRAE